MIKRFLIFCTMMSYCFGVYAYDWDGEAYSKFEQSLDASERVKSGGNKQKFKDSLIKAATEKCSARTDFAYFLAMKIGKGESSDLIRYANQLRTKTKRGNIEADAILDEIELYKLNYSNVKDYFMKSCTDPDFYKNRARDMSPTYLCTKANGEKELSDNSGENCKLLAVPGTTEIPERRKTKSRNE